MIKFNTYYILPQCDSKAEKKKIVKATSDGNKVILESVYKDFKYKKKVADYYFEWMLKNNHIIPITLKLSEI